MLEISRNVSIPESEIQMEAIRAQGAGGQNVNKTASAIHLRFDIARSSLPEFYKRRLLGLNDQRVSADGVVVIKAQEHRSQEQNRAAALARLQELIRAVAIPRKARKPTAPSRAARRKRLEQKKQRGRIKALRGKVEEN